MRGKNVRQKYNNCTTCSLRAGTIFSGLDDEGALQLENMLRRVVYPEGFVLFMKGEKPRGVYCVCGGRVKLYLHSTDGRTAVLGYASPGSVIGVRAILSGKPHDFTAKTDEESRLSFIDKDDFMTLLRKNGGVCLRLAETLGEELSKAYEGFGNVALATSEERLASLLLRLCDEFGEPSPEGIVIKPGLSQEEMADMAGMSRRTLSRALRSFRRMKLVECGRRITVVRNRSALEKLLP
ncbi:MAG: Crp/Fnr family transcriptional regulator [Candidatus Dadabacteria bacterium]|nr:Crp/Fnr family transcriptional regulator [Candidatus Dadabacteria bacterium]